MKTLIIVLIFISASISATEISLKSQSKQTQLIELYTSEGCSSCPPADRWMSSLKSSPALFKDFVPLAFHVDYWDYIGWIDELALKDNSKRQRRHKINNNLKSIYTPGVLKAGKEWRSWYGANIKESSKNIGALFVKIKDNKLTARFDTLNKSKYKLVLALLGMNIQTNVKAGENRGKTLKHDFVVLKQMSFISHQGAWEETVSNDFFQTTHTDTALVAWVEKENNPVPIQAVGTFL